MDESYAELVEVLRAAESGRPVSEAIVRLASRQFLTLIDGYDPGRAAVLDRARRIQQLQALRLRRAAICERLGISVQQYQRALESHRVSDEAVELNPSRSNPRRRSHF